MTVVEFLRARIAEDQAIAEKARDADGVGHVLGSITYLGAPAQAGEAHISRHDEDRVLRDVEIMRGIVDIHEQRFRGPDDWACASCPAEDHDADGNCLTLRLLTYSYADHEDYNEAWQQ